jgi:hypothetical protein
MLFLKHFADITTSSSTLVAVLLLASPILAGPIQVQTDQIVVGKFYDAPNHMLNNVRQVRASLCDR